MIRMRFYEGKTVFCESFKLIYHPDCVYQIEDDFAEELMVGSPPIAWPEGEERPQEWPPKPDDAEEVSSDESDISSEDFSSEEIDTEPFVVEVWNG